MKGTKMESLTKFEITVFLTSGTSKITTYGRTNLDVINYSTTDTIMVTEKDEDGNLKGITNYERTHVKFVNIKYIGTDDEV
jgi:hypothetical protein